MSIYHDEVEIEDFEYDEDDEMYYYPCPCGDRFQITKVFNRQNYCTNYINLLIFTNIITNYINELITIYQVM